MTAAESSCIPSADELLLEHVRAFLLGCDRGARSDDLEVGRPHREGAIVAFRVLDLLGFLRERQVDSSVENLWRVVEREGARVERRRIHSVPITV